MPLADISFGEPLLVALEIFFFVIWIWILITILTDLFRDHEMSGWAKAAWVLFLVFIPFLTALIYLIARGSGMRDRTIKAQAEAKAALRRLRPRTGPRHARRRTAQAQRPEGKGRALRRGVRQGEGETARLSRLVDGSGAAGAIEPSTRARIPSEGPDLQAKLQVISNS